MSCRDRVATLDAPARINILGEHVDYVRYVPTSSLTFGSDRHRMIMRIKAAAGAEIQGESDGVAFTPFSCVIPPIDSSLTWEEYLVAEPALQPHWSSYVRGAIAYAAWKYGSALKRGFKFHLSSRIPACGGASSSSALTVLAGAAIRAVNDIAFDAEDLARDSARAEWFAGTRGGDMDHLTICLAEPERAIHLSYATSTVDFLSLPSRGVVWVTCFSEPADKGDAVLLEYNERAAVSRVIIPALISSGMSRTALPERLSVAEFASKHSEAFDECRRFFPELMRERSGQSLQIRRRALHHQGESERVERAVTLLRSVSPDDLTASWKGLGELLDQSHASLRDLYDVSTPEVERLFECVRHIPGVYGARLMGGGFGGNVLALIDSDAISEFTALVQSRYYAPRQRDAVTEGSILISNAGPGLSLGAHS